MPDTEKLLNAIEAFEYNAHGSDSADGDELSTQRSLSIEAYSGHNIEPAPEGRSQVTDRSLFSTIQAILPSLTRIFAGGDNVVEFEPEGPEDEDGAEQESQVLNYYVTQKNNWFLTCVTWFTDALLTKNAYCMAYMEDKSVPETEIYEDQAPEQLALLLQDDLEIIGQEEVIHEDDLVPVTDESGQPVIDPFTGQPMMQPRVTYNVEVKRVKNKKTLRLKVLPPERVKVGQDTPDFTLEDCNFFQYADFETISDLRRDGHDVADDIGSDDLYETEEDSARDEMLSGDVYYSSKEGDTVDPSMRQVLVKHSWIRYDYDEDGIAELQYVKSVGDEILERQVVSTIPVACIVPYVNTHRHMGISVSDLLFDIQRIKTSILRSGLDSLNMSTNPRHAISDQVNLDDMLVSRPGGLVRLKNGAVPGQGHIMPLPTEFVFPQAQEGLRHMDTVIEDRVGINKMFQGIDESNLNDHNRVGQLSTMAAQRVEMIARLFANGVERLFHIAHELMIKSGHQDETIKLRGQWVDVSPSSWSTGRDMRVTAPFAAGNKDVLLQRLMIVSQIHEKALAGGLPIVDANDSYQLALEISKAADLSGDKFFTDPASIPPKEPGPDYTAMALEIENRKVDQNAQEAQMDSEIGKYKADLSAEIDRYRADLDAQVKQYQTQANQELQIAIKQLELGGKVDLEQFKAELAAASQSLKAAPDESNAAVKAMQSASDRTAKAFENTVSELTRAISVLGGDKEIVRDEDGNIIGSKVKR